jgi:prepilin-type N-terminal cleavage/methylation domain-containing protein
MTKHPPAQRGMALIEALIASAVLGIGLVGATQLTLKTLYAASASRQHTAAQHLAQEAMDCLQTQVSTAVCLAQEDIMAQGVRYTRQASSTPRGDGLVNDLQVSVDWTSSETGTNSRLEWHSSRSTVPVWVGVSSP